jgi:hypothetical protein
MLTGSLPFHSLSLTIGNIGGKHNLDRKPTSSELAIGKFSTLISNFSKFKESGQKPVRYS